MYDKEIKELEKSNKKDEVLIEKNQKDNEKKWLKIIAVVIASFFAGYLLGPIVNHIFITPMLTTILGITYSIKEIYEKGIEVNKAEINNAKYRIKNNLENIKRYQLEEKRLKQKELRKENEKRYSYQNLKTKSEIEEEFFRLTAELYNSDEEKPKTR